MATNWRTAHATFGRTLLGKAERAAAALGRGGRALFLILTALLLLSGAGLLYTLKESLVTEVPSRGGSLSEGIIGTPRFINPVLALSDADRDLTALVYSGLLRATSAGRYEPDLAESYSISDDGKVYTFTLREGLTFHDGSPLAAEDVVFTVGRAQEAPLKSPLRPNWDGVAVEAVDQRTVRFTLKAAYAPFIENLTLGILPKARWQDVSSDEFPFSRLNAEPVGSGPYKVAGVARTSSGIPARYTLVSFDKYALGEPYIRTIVVRFYQSEQALLTALQRGEIDSASGISPVNLSKIAKDTVRTSPLNRVFGVFFNQNQSSLLRSAEVRMALSLAVDRDDLIAQVLGGYGVPLDAPVPPNLPGGARAASADASTTPPQAARAYLLSRGWSAGEDGVLQKKSGNTVTRLEFDLSTGNVPELRAAAEYLRAAWGETGARVNVKIFEAGDLAQNVIRPRKYDALLFGQVVGRELDLFAFWHSSQRNDPGLNIAGYANANADKALERLRATADVEEREALVGTFLTELKKDLPAVFLYAPDFVYSIPNDIAGVDLGFIETPSDRFLSLPSWHRETDRVWPFFARSRE